MDHMVDCMADPEMRKGALYSEENFARQNPIAVGKQLRAVVDQVVGKDYPWRGVP